MLSKRQPVLKEGLRGIAVSNGSGSPASGDGESCPSGGQCSRMACGGQQFPMARAHQLEGTGSRAQVAVGAQGGPGGDGSTQRPGLTSPGGQEVPPRRRSVFEEGLRGTAVPNGPGFPA